MKREEVKDHMPRAATCQLQNDASVAHIIRLLMHCFDKLWVVWYCVGRYTTSFTPARTLRRIANMMRDLSCARHFPPTSATLKMLRAWMNACFANFTPRTIVTRTEIRMTWMFQQDSLQANTISQPMYWILGWVWFLRLGSSRQVSYTCLRLHLHIWRL